MKSKEADAPKAEACCEQCRIEIEKRPQNALLVMAECQQSIRVTEFNPKDPFPWD